MKKTIFAVACCLMATLTMTAQTVDKAKVTANAEAAAILSKAQKDVELEKKRAVNDAKNEISSMALAIAEKVVSRELNGKDQKALVDQFIDELGDQP